MKRQLVITLGAAILTIGTAFYSFAGQWNQVGTEWKYQNDDGTYAANGWHWIDGNNDGIAECYYFDADGWMLANTTTPDGYQVDGNGAWVQNGAVQTKQTGVQMGQQGQTAQNTNVFGNDALANAMATYGISSFESLPQAVTAGMNIGGSSTTDPGYDWSTPNGPAGVPKWKKANGSYAANEWIKFVTGVGVDQYVYFFGDEYAHSNETTPDGKYVDEAGKWAINGRQVWTVSDDKFNLTSQKTASNTNQPKVVSGDNYILSGEALDRVNGIYDEDAYIEEMVELVNKERAKKNRQPVELDDELTEYAMMRAKEIAELYSHKRPNGGYSKYAENVVNGGLTPEDVMRGWMNSSGHKNNILQSGHTRIGVGVYYENGHYYWVQEFSNDDN